MSIAEGGPKGIDPSVAKSRSTLHRTDSDLLGYREVRKINEAVAAVNVEADMPVDWQDRIKEVVAGSGKLVELPGGKVSTSLEKANFTTVYKVVKGQDIEEKLPWLYELYQGTFKDLVSEVAGIPMEVDKDKKFGININTLTKDMQKDGYELHTDINPWTGLLAVTTINEGDGGELVLISPKGRPMITRPQAGWLYIFDGRNHPHKVKLLRQEGKTDTRITVPMDYVNVGWYPKRPPDLEAIFGNGNGGNNKSIGSLDI